MKLGVYEQIINDLFEEKISSLDQTRFYIGERPIAKNEVAKLLSMYLTNIFEQVLSEVVDSSDGEEENNDSSIQNGLNLANSIIRKLVSDFHLDSGNLVSAQARILTAVIDKTQSDYPDLAFSLSKTAGADPRKNTSLEDAVNAFETVEEVEAYDFTTGYPVKLVFNL